MMHVTLKERSPGVWRVRIETGRDGAGKRLFRYETVRGTADDAGRRRYAILNAHEEGTFAAPDKVTLRVFFDHWIKTRLALKLISRSTAENYEGMFTKHVAPTLGGKRVQRITGVDIQQIYTEMAGSLAANTTAHMHRIMTPLFKSARKAKIIKANPIEEVTAPSAAKPKPKAINEAAAVELLRTLAGSWLEPITLLGFGAGMRRGEVLGLRWKDLELDAARLHVRGEIVRYRDNSLEWKTPKTESGVRTISLPGELVDMLRRLRIIAGETRMRLGLGGRLDDAYVFTRDDVNPVNPDKLSRDFGTHCGKHGLPDFTFHGTRHTHATELLKRVGKEGAKAVSQRLGHADITVTLEVYQTVFESDDRGLADLAGGLLGGKK